MRYQKNPDGTSTYFYSNGSSFVYETTETVTFNSPNETRAYEIKYSNGTNVTVNKDGSKEIKAPGQNPSIVAAPAAPAPAPATPPPGDYDYEENLDDGTSFGGRRLQSLPPPPPPPSTTTTNTTTNTTAPAPAPAPAPATPVPPPAPPGIQTLSNIYVAPTPPAPVQSSVTPVMPLSFFTVPAPAAPVAQPTTYPNFNGFVPPPPMNITTQPVESEVWGTVVFYLDGRIRELLADGNSTWNLEFYNANQNRNITNLTSFNNTAYIRARVYTNGSYVLNFFNGEV